MVDANYALCSTYTQVMFECRILREAFVIVVASVYIKQEGPPHMGFGCN